MFMHRTQSTYGRLVPKPEADDKKIIDYIDEAPVPIQDQIENLRTKIALKERYNKVISEDLEESRMGTTSILQDLYTETRELRAQLIDALNAEKAAVQNALRTHRIYQLAMTEKKSSFAIPWLNDKLFDITKNFNSLLSYLALKRKKLEEAEAMVVMIEKWPRPGTLPWEVDAGIEFQRIENMIENMKVKGETAAILHSKYYEIKFILREEAGKYIPTLKVLESQLNTQQNELAGLKKMLRDAIFFRDEAEKNLHLTERESSENHKERRKQMAKMKKAVEKLLAENANPGGKGHKRAVPVATTSDDWGVQEASQTVTEAMLKNRRERIEDFQDRVHRLVDAMRVTDLIQVPGRLKTVKFLGSQLKAELDQKEHLRDVLLRQKAQLFLIQSHFRYTGQKQEELYLNRRVEYVAAINNVKKDVTEANKRLQNYGNITVEIRLAILSILNRIEEGRRRTKSRTSESDLKGQMKLLYSKVYKLVKHVHMLEAMFTDEPERDYGTLIKAPVLQPRLLRVGSPVVSDDSDADDDLPDLKIPNRQDIKQKSLRFIQQAILRRGLK